MRDINKLEKNTMVLNLKLYSVSSAFLFGSKILYMNQSQKHHVIL